MKKQKVSGRTELFELLHRLLPVGRSVEADVELGMHFRGEKPRERVSFDHDPGGRRRNGHRRLAGRGWTMSLLIAGEPAPPLLPRTARAVAAVDADLARLREQITSQETEFERAKARAEKLSEQRLKLVIRARADGDAKAATRLESLTPKANVATQEVADLEAVIDELHARVKARLGERAVAERVAKLAALTQAANAQLPASQELDALLAKVVEHAGQWVAGQTRVYQLAVDCGMTGMLRTPRQQLGDIINGFFFPLAPHYFDKSSRPGETSFTTITARHADPSVVKEQVEGTNK